MSFLHQRGPTQVVCLVMGGMLAVFIFIKWQLLQQQSQKTKQFDLALTPLIRSGDLDAITIAKPAIAFVGGQTHSASC